MREGESREGGRERERGKEREQEGIGKEGGREMLECALLQS